MYIHTYKYTRTQMYICIYYINQRILGGSIVFCIFFINEITLWTANTPIKLRVLLSYTFQRPSGLSGLLI
jgi:hypothetical protein